MKILKYLLVGQKVRATKDCVFAKAGEVYEIKDDGDFLYIGDSWTGCCACDATWQLLFDIKPHEHHYKCECGEERV